MKTVLTNTPLKVARLLKKLDKTLTTEHTAIGFDTEVAGPLLQGRDFVNISYTALLGFSIAFEDETCFYVPIRHKGNNATFLDLHHIMELVQGFAATGRAWAHNAKWDHQVAIRAGYPLEGLLDSMLAAWLVTGKNKGVGLKVLAREVLGRLSPEYDPTMGSKSGAEVLEYACHDALNTLQLGAHYTAKMSDTLVAWFDEECKFTHALAEMKLAGFALDRKKLVAIRRDADAVRTAAAQRWNELAPDVKITSSKALQDLFTEGLWLTERMTKTGNFSTDADTMREQVANKTPGADLAQARLDYQEVTKIVNTYTDGLIEEALQWSDKKLHPDLFHLGTVTGRLSSSHPNIQNQPAHGEWSKLIKECFIPDPGFEFTSADYSQNELRYFADYCGGALVEAFVEGKDLHVETGEAMGVNRDKGKTVNFGFLLYGGGPRKLATLIDVGESQGKEKLALLAAKYPRIEAWRDHVIEKAAARGPVPWVKTRAGRIRYIPELDPHGWYANNKESYMLAAIQISAKYGFAFDAVNRYANAEFKFKRDSALFSRGKRLVVNYLVQGGSRDLLVLAMNRFRTLAPEGFTLVTTVHDEILTQHPIGRGDEARALLKNCMESVSPALGLKVPVLAEPKTGKDWFSVK